MNQILYALQALKGKAIDPNIVRQALETIDFKNILIKDIFTNNDLDVHNRYMIMEDLFQVYFMVWSPQFFFPIHQHNNFWGFVIPIKGVLSETIYGYAPNKKKVFIHPTKSFKSGEIIYEPLNVIHKLQNASPIDTLTTLHVYYPPTYNFSGTKIFDAKNRKLAVLNEKALTLGWDLPKDQYEMIEKNAYDLEKLW
jgi:predicted metal-dependent enzyme (double-stranded beta helix superfamily)